MIRAKGYLIIEPTYAWRGATKPNGARLIAVRKSKPAHLENYQRAVELDIELSDSFFDPPQIAVLAGQIEEPDTPESIVAKMQGLVLVRELAATLGNEEQDPASDR